MIFTILWVHASTLCQGQVDGINIGFVIWEWRGHTIGCWDLQNVLGRLKIFTLTSTYTCTDLDETYDADIEPESDARSDYNLSDNTIDNVGTEWTDYEQNNGTDSDATEALSDITPVCYTTQTTTTDNKLNNDTDSDATEPLSDITPLLHVRYHTQTTTTDNKQNNDTNLDVTEPDVIKTVIGHW